MVGRGEEECGEEWGGVGRGGEECGEEWGHERTQDGGGNSTCSDPHMMHKTTPIHLSNTPAEQLTNQLTMCMMNLHVHGVACTVELARENVICADGEAGVGVWVCGSTCTHTQGGAH